MHVLQNKTTKNWQDTRRFSNSTVYAYGLVSVIIFKTLFKYAYLYALSSIIYDQ